jgi:hypothetical protein
VIDNKKHTFVIHARPAGVPLELQNLPGDTAVRVTSDICRTQYEGTTTAEEVMRELKSTIDRQSEGFYTINEVAQIWADATGTDPKRQREKLWKEIEQGRLRAFDEADKFDTLDWSKVKYSCLVRETDLREIGVFPKVPAKSPVQQTASPATVETVEQRQARWLERFDEAVLTKQRGALQRVFERERKENPKADRSYMGKVISQARAARDALRRGNAFTAQLVQAGKRQH